MIGYGFHEVAQLARRAALRGHQLDAASWAGAAIVAVAILFYLLVEARWFALQFGNGLLRGGMTALAGIVEGLIIVLGAGLLLGL